MHYLPYDGGAWPASDFPSPCARLAVVVAYFLIDLAQSLSFLSGHKVTVSRAFINVPLEFVAQALLGGGRELLRFWLFIVPLLLRRAVYDLSAR